MVAPAGFLGVPLVRSYLQTDAEIRGFAVFQERATDLAELAPSSDPNEVARRCRWVGEVLGGGRAWEGHVPTIAAALVQPDDPGDASALHQIWRFLTPELRNVFMKRIRPPAEEDEEENKRPRQEDEPRNASKRGREEEETDDEHSSKRTRIVHTRQDLPPAPQDQTVDAEWLEPLGPELVLAVRQGVPLLEILAVSRLWRHVDERALLRALYARDLERPPPLDVDREKLRALYARALFQGAAHMAVFARQHGQVTVWAHAGHDAMPLFVLSSAGGGITRTGSWRGRLPPVLQRAWDAVGGGGPEHERRVAQFLWQLLLRVTAHAIVRSADGEEEMGVISVL